MNSTLLAASQTSRTAPRVHRGFLASGITASLLYLAMNVSVPMLDPDYNWLSQTVSELSAINAPTRTVWLFLGVAYGILVVLFGWGVWALRDGPRKLHMVGALLVLNGILSLYWPPMHLRGAELSLTDTFHIVWAVVTVLLMASVIILAAFSFTRSFRAYSLGTLIILLGTGFITGLDGPRIAENLPTPWVGLWERLSIGVYMAWVIVFALILLRSTSTRRL